MGSQIGHVGVLDGGVVDRAKSNGSNEFFPTLGDRNKHCVTAITLNPSK